MSDTHEHTTNGHSAPASPVPDAAIAAIEEDIAVGGGPFVESPADAGSAGRTMFDTPASEDNTITVLVPREQMRRLPSQALVRIESREDGRAYLGVVVAGPFAEPDGLRGDAPVVITAAVNGGMFLPRYHGRVHVEILGEDVDGALVPPRYRPLPNSIVFPLSAEETERVLKAGGDVRIGLAVGHEAVEVAFDSARKDALPRHTAILGTTGGGKSTTVAGLIARLQAAGVAVVLLDTEGEYTHLNEPTEDRTMLAALKRLGASPAGVPDTHVYYPVGRDTANADHPRVQPFRMRFSDLPAEAVMEILDLNDAQRVRYLLAYDVTKRMLRELDIFPKRGDAQHAAAIAELDELESGYPSMALGHLIDVASALLTALKTKDEAKGGRGKRQPVSQEMFGELEPAAGPFTTAFHAVSPLFQQPENTAKLREVATQYRGETSHEVSWLALLSRLRQLHRIGIFDTDRARTRADLARTDNGKVRPLPVKEMLSPGCVSIIDLHDSDSPAVNNIVIAGLLRDIQNRQEDAYDVAMKRNDRPTPVVVFIEEAHEFLSRERINRMPVLYQQVARIARRGRKRWLGLAFITQLPQHLPDEVFGLVNNFILHKIGDANVVNRLKLTVPGIDASLWKRLPGLAPGQAIVSVTGMTRPLLVAVDPAPAKLRMVE
ncbi:MAG: ATP-binding protein [Dehalococcoidia bacterium]